MKQYGKMFRHIRRAEQPEKIDREGKRLCPKCRCWKDESEYIGSDRLPKRYCENCRSNMGRKF